MCAVEGGGGEARDRDLESVLSLSPSLTRLQISNPVSGGQCHLIHLTILSRVISWPSLA